MRIGGRVIAGGWTGWFRSLILFAVLAAFNIQGYLVQTHIHGLPDTVAATAEGTFAAPWQDGDAPIDVDHCLLCQEFLHAGAYFIPAAAAVLPPMVAVAVVESAPAPLPLKASPSHIWMGRAPPRA